MRMGAHGGVCGTGMTILSKSLEDCWRTVEQGRSQFLKYRRRTVGQESQFSANAWRTVRELWNRDDSSQAILGELSENCGPGMTVLGKSLENCWRIVEQGRQFSAISWRTVGELLVRNGSSQQILGELLENCETGTTFLSQFLENC